MKFGASGSLTNKSVLTLKEDFLPLRIYDYGVGITLAPLSRKKEKETFYLSQLYNLLYHHFNFFLLLIKIEVTFDPIVT